MYNQPITKLVDFIVPAHQENPTMNFEVFVHKCQVEFPTVSERTLCLLAYFIVKEITRVVYLP